MLLRIVQISDLHLLTPGELLMDLDVEERFRNVLRTAERYRPDALFLTGDCCAHEPNEEVYDRIRPLTDAFPAPLFTIPGNHDDRVMLRRAFPLPGAGDDPIHFHARIGSRDFIFLDTSEGMIDVDQLSWLEGMIRQFPAGDIVMHHPPLACGVEHMDAKYPLRNNGPLLDLLLEDGRQRRVFCGHYHSARAVAFQNLNVYLCPPTSFFIDPRGERFQLLHRPPGFHLLEWAGDGAFRCADIVVETSA